MNGEADEADVEGYVAELKRIKDAVSKGQTPTASVRELLRWFGVYRRRAGAVERIEGELEAISLRTEPDFTSVWIDAEITFKALQTQAKGKGTSSGKGSSVEPDNEDSSTSDAQNDGVHLVRMLDAANRTVVAVNPQDPIQTAITLMLAHDFSQLAVMTNSRELKGAISWKSIGGRLSQKKVLNEVQNAMEPASEVLDTASLFEATKRIIDHDYVFVRSADRQISGIVTATDLSERFQSLSEPFLLLGRIENQIRKLIQASFDADTIQAACDDNDPERKAKVTRATQLTFGEYQRMFEKEENWEKLNFIACRKTFCHELDEIRIVRNDIMHFHPDVGSDDDWAQLHRFSRLLEQLEKLSD